MTQPQEARKSKILKTQIDVASNLWKEMQFSEEPADRWLASFFQRNKKVFGSRDRRFFSAIIFGLMRHRLYVEAWSKELAKKKDPRLSVVLIICMEGLIPFEEWQEFAQEFCKTPEACKKLAESLEKRALPAIKDEERLSVQYSIPSWLLERWRGQWDESECVALLRGLQERPRFSIRVNTLKTDRDSLLKQFKDQGYEASTLESVVNGIWFEKPAALLGSAEFRKGAFEVQDEGSQRVGRLIDAQPGERIWDMCAGAGGKTLLMAAMMKNSGDILASDIRPQALGELERRARRAGVKNVKTVSMEALDRAMESQPFDKVLIDAPCSGTGTLRRSPDLKWRLNPKKLEEYQTIQAELLGQAPGHLKPGGRLYYVTCSLDAAENELQMAGFLKAHADFKLVPFPESPDGYFRLLPHRDKCDGFFLAIAEKCK